MKTGLNFGPVLRALRRVAASSLLLGTTGLCMMHAVPALAAGGKQILVVSNDRGGLVRQRATEIMALQKSGQPVELRGRCLSTCTMYLSLTNVCVATQATFGFHGPSWYGVALSPAAFEHWSQVMARHYREPLRSWYLSTARHRINDYYRLSGADLIGMGYAACQASGRPGL